jgi:hypothetical protein
MDLELKAMDQQRVMVGRRDESEDLPHPCVIVVGHRNNNNVQDADMRTGQ